MIAVFPSALKATPEPWKEVPAAPEPTNLFPCCVQVDPLLVYIQAAPLKPSS